MRAPLLLASFGCVLLACGDSGDTSSTTTGATTGSATTSASTGAGAGGPAPCTMLVENGPLTAIPGMAGTISSGLKLHELAQGNVEIVRTIAIPGTGPVSTIGEKVAWTTAWPPTTEGVATLADKPGYVSAVSTAKPDAVGLLGTPKAGGAGMAFGLADMTAGDWNELVTADPMGLYPVFAAGDANGNYFVGVGVSAGISGNNAAVPHLGWVSTSGATSYVGPVDVGCPIDPVSASGIATAAGWLFARSAFDSACTGSMGRVEVTSFSPNGAQSQPGASMPAGPYAGVQLVPRQNGAWLFFSQGGTQAARLDLLGNLELGPTLVSSGTALAAADALDDGLVVAANHTGDSNLDVVVTDVKMQPIGTAPLTLMSEPAWVQVAFHEASRQVLVAVVQDTPGMSPAEDVYLARFACQ